MDAQSPMALILLGQIELWDRLRHQSFAAMRQRIDIQFKLGHYDRSHVGEYITNHHQNAGVDQPILSDSAIDEIHRFSGSSARLINKGLYTYFPLWCTKWMVNHR
jgi:general secretion pathway protein A